MCSAVLSWQCFQTALLSTQCNFITCHFTTLFILNGLKIMYFPPLYICENFNITATFHTSQYLPANNRVSKPQLFEIPKGLYQGSAYYTISQLNFRSSLGKSVEYNSCSIAFRDVLLIATQFMQVIWWQSRDTKDDLNTDDSAFVFPRPCTLRLRRNLGQLSLFYASLG